MHKRKYILATDGGSRGNPGQGGYAWALFEEGKKNPIDHGAGRIDQICTNNEAEYYALIKAFEALRKIAPLLGVAADIEIEHRSDSQLLVNQMTMKWQMKNEKLRELRAKVRLHQHFLPHFAKSDHRWVERTDPYVAHCDWLYNRVLDAVPA